MRWEIAYFNEKVEHAVFRLPKTLLARYVHMTSLMQEYGPNLGMPHTRYMSDNLFEMRLKGQEGIARVFYCAIMNKEIVVLHAFVKKQQKTPAKELKIAKQRLKEVLDYAKT
jgi:phage-related protein